MEAAPEPDVEKFVPPARTGACFERLQCFVLVRFRNSSAILPLAEVSRMVNLYIRLATQSRRHQRARQSPWKPPEASDSLKKSPRGDEVEKKVRALRKKLRDIEKLKEKVATGAPIDLLQKQKLDGEAEIIQQIRSLGAEP
ncbi:SPBC4B4.04 [Symbiodinium sp. CCMP2592]|nr:SPBC4B4.04 [Symbiodinium sp. CCMP2592]